MITMDIHDIQSVRIPDEHSIRIRLGVRGDLTEQAQHEMDISPLKEAARHELSLDRVPEALTQALNPPRNKRERCVTELEDA